MSYDLFLIEFAKGIPTELPRDAIKSVLGRVDHRPTGHGFYDVGMPDGSIVESQIEDPFGVDPIKSCMLTPRGMTMDQINFLFELTRATEGVLIASDKMRILGNSRQRAELPPDFAPPDALIVECTSPKHLADMLEPSFKSFCQYRDQVCGDGKQPPA